MKIVYTNISPVTNAYTNINHILDLKKQSPQKVYLCVWDKFVFEHPVFEHGLGDSVNRMEKLWENTKILEKLMIYFKIDYKIILLSEAMNRLFKNSDYLSEFQDILSNIKIGNLERGSELEYVPFHQISLSKINYIVSDYLIALHLPELFPEICSSCPNYYFTSERFKIFEVLIKDSLKYNSNTNPSLKSIYVNRVPIIIHPEKELIPALGMSIANIKKITKSYYKSKPESKEVIDIINILSEVLNKFMIRGKMVRKSMAEKAINSIKYDDFIEFISTNFFMYFSEISNMASKIEIEKQKKSLFISSYEEFSSFIKPLNNIKLDILKNCNGNNTSLDISKNTGLKLSTVSTYLTRLRNNGLIDSYKKPRRVVDSFVVDLEIMNK